MPSVIYIRYMPGKNLKGESSIMKVKTIIPESGFLGFGAQCCDKCSVKPDRLVKVSIGDTEFLWCFTCTEELALKLTKATNRYSVVHMVPNKTGN